MRTLTTPSDLTEDLAELVASGSITMEEAAEMMSPKLTADLQRLVEEGEITQEQAQEVMQQSKAATSVVRLCGKMVATGALTVSDWREGGNHVSKPSIISNTIPPNRGNRY